MTTEIIGTLSEKAASDLWDDLRSAWGNFERVLGRIIETRAWEPLGYETFAEAWQDRMRGTRLLTAAAQALALAQLRVEGKTTTEMVAILGPGSGISPARVPDIVRQLENGKHPGLVTNRGPMPTGTGMPTVVREHTRERPTPPRFVHVELTETEYVHFRAVAEGRGLDLADEGGKAVRAWFARLERRDGQD